MLMNIDYIKMNDTKLSFLVYDNGDFLYKEVFGTHNVDSLNKWWSEQLSKISIADTEMYIVLFAINDSSEIDVVSNKPKKKISCCVITPTGLSPLPVASTKDILLNAVGEGGNLESNEEVVDFDKRIFK